METIKKYWHILMVWLGLEAPTVDETISIFAKEEQEKERKTPTLTEQGYASGCVPPDLRVKTTQGNKRVGNLRTGDVLVGSNSNHNVTSVGKRNKVKVRDNNSSGYSYKYENELDVSDIILGYMLYNALTDSYTESSISPTPSLEWTGFGGATDNFAGGGAGGSWDNDKGSVAETSTYSTELYS